MQHPPSIRSDSTSFSTYISKKKFSLPFETKHIVQFACAHRFPLPMTLTNRRKWYAMCAMSLRWAERKLKLLWVQCDRLDELHAIIRNVLRHIPWSTFYVIVIIFNFYLLGLAQGHSLWLSWVFSFFLCYNFILQVEKFDIYGVHALGKIIWK